MASVAFKLSKSALLNSLREDTLRQLTDLTWAYPIVAVDTAVVGAESQMLRSEVVAAS